MEPMDMDEEAVVDLSLSGRRQAEVRNSAINFSSSNINASTSNVNNFNNVVWPSRRSLRPRTEHRSYVESPDIVIVDDEPRTNGYANGNCETDDEDFVMPPLPTVREMPESERVERERRIQLLRDQLRNEEMTLVLLKKIQMSHQVKENVAVVTPSSSTVPAHVKQAPPRSSSKPLVQPAVQHMMRAQPILSSRGVPPVHIPPPQVLPSRAPGIPSMHQAPPASISRVPGGSSMPSRSLPGMNFVQDRKDPRHSPAPPVTQQMPGNVEKVGMPVPMPSASDQDRVRIEESQTPAQRQAAAKLALRKQLEKTLLQIPPPKPPPPEMHFIPNPSNTEFIYLVGLEHVVDYITKDSRSPPPPEPFRCSQCSTDFTPVWKWERGSIKGKEPKVICEQCVTTNVKKALKAEHTNRLKTAFVKALQQEQEIEQRLAQASPQPEPPPPPPPAPPVVPPPPPPPSQPVPVAKPTTPKPPPGVPSPNRDHLAKLADSAKFNPHAAAAIQHQLFRGMPQHQPLPAHMLPFSPLLYPYQLAMAQAAGGKGPMAAAAAANIAEMQRQAADIQRQAADMQRQYLLDMIPPSSASRHSINNWKT